MVLRHLEAWCQFTELSVNPHKIEMVLFTRRRRVDGFTAPQLFGHPLVLQDQVKYLGVIFDKQLRWKAHLDRQRKRAIAVLWQCRRVIGKMWGLQPKYSL